MNESFHYVCSLSDLKQTKKGITFHIISNNAASTALLSCQKGYTWPLTTSGKTSAELQMSIEANSKPHDLVILQDDCHQSVVLIGVHRPIKLDGFYM